MTQNFPDNTLYEMDNLDVLRGMNSNTVDLIATDPPFNTKRNRSGSAGFYVDNWKWGDTSILPDQWKWNEVHPKWLEEIKDNHTALHHAIDAAKHCQGEDTAAFLCFLSVRLIEMHRILKDTGSIYLHCDPTASHYIKMCMDAIWGKKNFCNEIVWERIKGAGKTSQHAPRSWGRSSDSLLWYSKNNSYQFNSDAIKVPYSEEYLMKNFPNWDDKGRYKKRSPFRPPGLGARPNLCYEYKGFIPPHPSGWTVSKSKLKTIDDEGDLEITPDGKVYRKQRPDGMMPNNIWTDISQAAGNERTGSPDQKPLQLYKRVIKASSNEGDLVLDPFCGCATTIIAAQQLNRRWIGIDRRKDARYHIIIRLMGISPKERKRLEKYGTDKEWLDRQMQPYEMYYQTEPPIRTDTEKQTSPKLAHIYPIESEHRLSHAEMHDILINQFGLKCWGCNFIPPDKRYLQLDHIIPKIDGGTNDIDNRALLCQPCNLKKSSKMSLNALRKQNKRDGHIQPNLPIDLQTTLVWTRNYLIRTIRETPHQLNLNRF